MQDNIFPLVSVVTPSFNQARYLERTILSVLSQGYPNLEYIIVDGGSTDGSLDIIRKYADRLSYWVSEPDRGQSDAINKGWSRATGEILAWLNSDDTYQPGAIARAVDFLDKNPDVDFVYGLCHATDEDDRVTAIWDPPEFRLKWLIRLGISNIPQQTVFFRRKVLDGVGELDINLDYAMDYDFFIRIALKGYRIRKIPCILANYRLHPTSKSISQRATHFRESHTVRKRYLHEPWVSWFLGFWSYKAHRAATKLATAVRRRTGVRPEHRPSSSEVR